ncbi:MAG: hypothetical protein R3B81_17685 [bacterium]
MSKVRRFVLGAALAGGAALAAGCAGSPPRLAEPSGGARTAADWVRIVSGRNDSLRTLRADLEISWAPDADTEPQSCRGAVSFESPGLVRLRGTSLAFFAIFDLVVAADGTVWLDLPQEKFGILGDRSDPAWDLLPLSPDRVLAALLGDPRLTPEEIAASTLASSDSLVVVSGDWGRLEIAPETGLPSRWERGAGQVVWSDWGVRSGRATPGRTLLIDPEGGRLEVSYGRFRVDEDLPPGRFTPTIEEDREILTPGEGLERWSRTRIDAFRTN